MSIAVGIAVFGIAIGAGIAAFAVGSGISRIGANAVEGISRQPEAANKIQIAMIISAALIEGVGLLALVIIFLLQGKV